MEKGIKGESQRGRRGGMEKGIRVSQREAGGGEYKRKELRVSHREAGGGEYKRKELRVSHREAGGGIGERN